MNNMMDEPSAQEQEARTRDVHEDSSEAAKMEVWSIRRLVKRYERGAHRFLWRRKAMRKIAEGTGEGALELVSLAILRPKAESNS